MKYETPIRSVRRHQSSNSTRKATWKGKAKALADTFQKKSLLKRIIDKHNSRVKTKTKRKIPHIIKSPEEGMSFSKTKMVYKMQKVNKLWHKIAEPTTVAVNTTGQLIVPNGTQGRVQLGQYFNGGSGFSGHSNGLSINLNQLYEDTLGNSAGASDTLGGSTIVKKLLLDHVNVEYLLQSGCATQMIIDIYDVYSKTTTSGSDTPIQSWDFGINQEENALTNASDYFANKPTQVKNFNMNFKVIKKTTVDLGPGRAHRHVFSFSPNRFIDLAYGNSFIKIKGITCYTFVVVRGGTVVKNTANSGEITVSSSDLLWEGTAKYSMRPCLYTPKKELYFSSLPTFNYVQEKFEGEFTQTVLQQALV